MSDIEDLKIELENALEEIEQLKCPIYPIVISGGVLTTIMSAGVTFRENKKTKEFREQILEPHGTYLEHLPSGAFKESGTMVNTVLLRLVK